MRKNECWAIIRVVTLLLFLLLLLLLLLLCRSGGDHARSALHL
jgi:hypothetical protein